MKFCHRVYFVKSLAVFHETSHHHQGWCVDMQWVKVKVRVTRPPHGDYVPGLIQIIGSMQAYSTCIIDLSGGTMVDMANSRTKSLFLVFFYLFCSQTGDWWSVPASANVKD